MSTAFSGRRWCRWMALACALILPSTGVCADSVKAIPALDLQRFMGAWFVAAQYPTKFQKKCMSNNQMLYALDDKAGHFQMGVFCTLKNGSPENVNYSGKRDKIDDGKLTVSYLVLFSKKYWIFAIDPNYGWAVMGAPNHKTLWVLSRKRVLAPEDLQQARSAAAANGFDPDKLVTPRQVPPGYTDMTISSAQP